MRDDLQGQAHCWEDDWLISQCPELGYAAEVGAYDGFTGSCTYRMEKMGWKVLCVEPNPMLESALRGHRALYWMGAASDHSGIEPFHVYEPTPAGFSSLRPNKTHPDWVPDPNGKWSEHPVRVETMDALLEQFQFPRLDCLSIDTEGTEIDVLKGLDLDRWGVRCLTVESWDDPNHVTKYLAARGFTRVERRLVTDLFVRQ